MASPFLDLDQVGVSLESVYLPQAGCLRVER